LPWANIYDAETELIGFTDGLLTITDSIINKVDLKTLKFNQEPDDVLIDYQEVGQNLIQEKEENNIKLWFDNENTFDLYVSNDTLWNDTIRIPGEAKTDFISTAELTVLNLDQLGKPKNMNPFVNIKMEANHPITQIDTSLIQVLEDSIKKPIQANIFIDTLLSRNLVFEYPWKEEKLYEVNLLPGALTDLYGLQNDTLQQKYFAASKTQFGSIKLKVINLDSLQQYILQLKTKNGNLVKEYIVKDKRNFEDHIKALYAGEYQLTIIQDESKNGKWDSGDYDEQKQPEEIFSKPLEALRANWELDAEVDLEQLNGNNPSPKSPSTNGDGGGLKGNRGRGRN